MARHKRVVLMHSTMPPSARRENGRDPKYIPPEGECCPVEKLPPEVIAYIFELGTRAEETTEDWEVEEDDGDDDYEDIDDSDDEVDMIDLDMPGSFTLASKAKLTDGADDGEDDANDATEKTPYLSFQVRMSHVCRRWRRIAIETPTLWTNLTFSEPRPFDKSREWILRSKQCPLDVFIDVTLPDEDLPELIPLDDQGHRDPNEEAAIQDLERILELVVPHVSRWRTFELSTSVYGHMYHALNFLRKSRAQDGAPLLQTLSLHCHDETEDIYFQRFAFSAHEKYISLFGGRVPKLSSITLWGVQLDWKMFIPLSEQAPPSLNDPPAATTELTDIEFAYHDQSIRPTYDDFVNIIRCAPKLSSLVLNNSGPSPRLHGQQVQPLFLPNLRHLTLGFLTEEFARSILHMLYAPALSSICLEFDEAVEDDGYTPLVRQLTEPMRIPDPPPPHIKGLIHLPPDSSGSTRIRTIDPSKPISILANVTDVKLGGLPCEDECATLFYSACPHLKRLHLNMHFLPVNFFWDLIGEEDTSRYSANGISVRLHSASSRGRKTSRRTTLCMHLESLTISGMTGAELTTFVRERKALGVPLRELRIDEMDDVPEEEEEWLRSNLAVLEFVEISDDEGESVDNDDDEDDLGYDHDHDEEGEEDDEGWEEEVEE